MKLDWNDPDVVALRNTPPPAPVAVAPPPDPSLLDYAAVAGQGLLELPQQAGASFRRAVSGMSGLIEEGESPEIAAAREANASFRAGVNARLGEDNFFGKMVDPASVASSATGLLGTGLVMASPFTGPAAPAVATAGGTLAAASLPGMYRDVSYGTLAEAIRVEEEKVGRTLTQEERQALYDANAETFQREGLVEAGGELVGTGASLLLSPAGGAAVKGLVKGGMAGAKLGVKELATRGAFRNAIGAGAAELTGEMVGETGTTVEQDINAQKLGLANAGLDRSFAGYFAAAKEVAPVVLGTAGLVGTVVGGTQKLADLATSKTPETRDRALEVLKFKTENPDVEIPDEIVAGYIGGLPLTGETPVVAPAPLITEQAVPPLPVETQTEVLAGVEPAPAPELLGLPAPVNISLASGEVIPAQQFYRMLNERLDAQAGGMTKEEVIRSRRRLMKEEQQFFEVQAIQAVPEEQRSGAEKAKLTKYNSWLAETVPAEAVTEQKELVDAVSEMQPVGTETRQEVQEPDVRVQGGEVTAEPGTPVAREAAMQVERRGWIDAERKTNPSFAPDIESWKELLPPTELAEVNEWEDLQYKAVALQGPEAGYKPYKLTTQQKGRLQELTAKYVSRQQAEIGAEQNKSVNPLTVPPEQATLPETSQGETMKTETPKQAWEMTKEAWLNDSAARRQEAEAAGVLGAKSQKIVKGGKALKDVYAKPDNEQVYNHAVETQRAAIKQALAAGKPVPAEVLADYPDLQPTKEATMRAERRAKKEVTSQTATTLPGAMIAAGKESAAELRGHMDAVKLGPIEGGKETITFTLDGKAYKGTLEGRNADLVVGADPDADKAIATRVFLDGHAVPLEEAAPPTLPRLKRGYRRSTFTVADPVYKNYVFVEDVSPKGVKTLYTKKNGEAEVKAATPAIASKVAKLGRTEAKFSEGFAKPNGGFGGLATVEEWRAKIRAGGIYDAVNDTFITPEERDRLTQTQSRGMTYSDDLSGAVQRLDNDETYTSFDFVDDVDQLLVEMDNPPKELEAALRKVRKEQDYDRKVSGRGNMESAYAAFEAAVRTYEVKSSPMVALANAISQETGQPVAQGVFTQVAPPKGQEALFAALAKTLKKEIVFFKNNGAPMSFNGATGIAEDTIYVNIDAAKPHLVVTGHEFLHDLKREEPETYAALRDVVMDVIPEKHRLAMWMGLNSKRVREGRGPIDLTAIDEELVADFFGEQFTSKEFWAKVERRNPEGFAGLVQRLVAFLDRIKAALTGEARADIERAQTAAAEALARYVSRNPEAEYELRFADLNTSPQFSELSQVIKGMKADLVAKAQPRVKPIEVNYEKTGGTPAGDNAAARRRQQERSLFEALGYGNSAVSLGEATHALAAQVTAGKLSRDGAAQAFGAALSKINADSLKDIRSDLQTMGYVIPASGKEAVTSMFIALGSSWQGYNTSAPQFSESYAAAPKQNLAKLKDSLLSGRVTTQALPSVLKVTPLPILADVADTMRLPWVRTFYKATMQRDAVSNGIVTDFGLLGKELAQSKETATLVANVADVASIHQMRPQDDIYSQDWIAEAMRGAEDTKPETKEALLKGAQTAWEAAGMQTSTGKTFREAYLASKQAFDALPEDLQEHYLRAVEMMKDLRQREKDAAQALIEEHTQDNPELRVEQIAQLDFAYNNLKGNYWPVYRKGDYTLDYIETATGLRGYSSFDTVFEREVVAKTLVDSGLVDPATIKLSKKADTPRGSYGVPAGYNTALGKAIEDKAIAAATEGIDPKDTQAMEAATAQARQTAQETIQTLHEVWLRFQPEASAAKNMMRRKNIKGYDGDMVRGFLEYGQTHGVKVAQMEQGRKVERTINDMAAAIRGRTNEGFDTTRDMAILNDLRAREAVKSQPSHWLAKKLGAWTTFRYMTSPSIALVQMTQLGILTFPKLATLKGSNPTKAAGALRRGTQAAFSTKFTREKMLGDVEVQTVYDSLHEVVTTETRRENPGQYDDVPLGTAVYTPAELQNLIDKLTPYQQQLLALQEAMDRGLLDISLSHEVNEQVERKDMNPITGRVFDLGMTFMRESEKASRKAAILAAFEVGGGTKDFFAGMETVAEVVDNTLFNYAKSAKGVALQGDLVRVLTTFQTFRINAIGKLFILFRQTIKGETAEVQQAAKRELIGIFGMSGILAGTLGMPFAPLIFQLFDAIIGDDDDEPSEEQFRKWLAANFGQTTSDVVAEGVPSILGASLSRRIGLGDVVGSSAEMPARLVGDGAMNWYATQLAGPSYSMVAGYAKGYNEIFNEGEVVKGLISSTPKPIGDALKAYGYASDGVKTGMGKRLLTADQVGSNEVLLQAFGFAPLEIGRLKSAQYDINTRSTRLSMQWGQIKQDLVKAYIDGEPTDDEMVKVREFLAAHPGLVQNVGGEIRSSLREYLKKDAGVDSRREMLLKR